MSGVQPSHSSSQWSFTSQWCSSPSHRTPRLGYPTCNSHSSLSRWMSIHVSSLFLWIPSQEHRSWLIPFLSFLPNHLCILLIALVVQGSFCQFPISFQWECSTCRLFLMCSWKKVISMSSYFAIWSISHLTLLLNGASFSNGEIVLKFKIITRITLNKRKSNFG